MLNFITIKLDVNIILSLTIHVKFVLCRLFYKIYNGIFNINPLHFNPCKPLVKSRTDPLLQR